MPSPIDRRLGARLALLRQQAGLSQGQLAMRLGVEPISVPRWEAGELRLRAADLPPLVEALQCSVRDLYRALHPAGDAVRHLQKPVGVEPGDLG